MTKKEFQIIKVGDLNIKYYRRIPKLEAKIVFERDHLNQKLLFSLMDITYKHGMSCSAPKFIKESEEFFLLIDLPLSSTRVYKKGLEKMHVCLQDVVEFSYNFLKQLNFDKLDVSMFVPEDVERLYPEQWTAIKDQNYDGSWEEMCKDLKSQDQKEELDLIKKCMEFENKNNKDLGLIGDKLVFFLEQILYSTNKMEIN